MHDPRDQSRTFSELIDPTHLSYQVSHMCNRSIDRSVKPATVVVTKTQKTFEESHKRWEERVTAAQKAYHLLPQELLKQCLGEGYQEFMTLQVVKLTKAAPIGSPGSNAMLKDVFENESNIPTLTDQGTNPQSNKRSRDPKEDGQNSTSEKSRKKEVA